ncbi:MAG: hypothetical protein WC483_04385 [Candidatus Paceibacterota bacterium]
MNRILLTFYGRTNRIFSYQLVGEIMLTKAMTVKNGGRLFVIKEMYYTEQSLMAIAM